MTTVEEKAEVSQFEGDAVTEIDGYESYGLVKSRFDELSIPRTLWVFKRVVLVTLAVYTGYVCEGFEVSETLCVAILPVTDRTQLGAGGTVIANAGFIKQFGDHDATGVRALNPTWGKSGSSIRRMNP
jgi:MFS transporter, SP family, general alpha glucoside:H+ symporter